MASVGGIRGRYFAVLIEQALKFYGRHETTLAPVLTAAVVAAINELIANLPAIISSLNPEGPG